MRWTAAIGLCVLLAGCGRTQGVPLAVAQPLEFQAADQPPSMPAFAKVFPLGEVILVSQMGDGVTLIYKVNAPPQDVLDYHRRTAKAAGLDQERVNPRDDDHTSRTFTTAAGRDPNLTVEVSGRGGRSMVYLSYHLARAKVSG